MPLGRCRLCHLRFESAFAVESLDAMILAIGDVDPPIGITGNVVREVELPGPRACCGASECVSTDPYQ